MNSEFGICICVRNSGRFGDLRKIQNSRFLMKVKFLMCVSQIVVASEINQK